MSLILHYPLNGDILDYSGNGNNAIYNNAILDDNGKIGKCYSFGDNKSIYTDVIDFHGDISFALWIYPLGDGIESNFGGLLSNHCHTSSPANFTINRYNDGKISIDAGFIDGTRSDGIKTESTIPLNKWSHITFTYNVSNNTGKIYFDGILQLEKTFPKQVAFKPYNVIIGQWAYSYIQNYEFNGKINDVRIYDHTLSEKEVKEIYKTKILHYTFNDFQEPTQNLISVNKQKFKNWFAYQGTIVTLTQNISVPEWNTTEAIRIQTIGGTNVLKYYVTVLIPKVNTIYNTSVYVKNIGSSSLKVHNQYAFKVIPAGEIDKVSLNFIGNGSTHCQLRFEAVSDLTDSLDFIAFQPQGEFKDHSTPFTPTVRQGVFHDISGYNHNTPLTLENTPQWVADSKIGTGCYKFDGTQNINCGGICNFKDELSISAWIKYKYPFTGCILTKNNSGGWVNDPFIFLRAYYNYPTISLSDGTNVQRYQLPNIGDENWHHVAFSLSLTKFKVYIDNTIVKNVDRTIGELNNLNAKNLFIGTSYSGSGGYNGLMDDICIYATALSNDDVKGLYERRASLDNHGNFYINQIVEGLKSYNYFNPIDFYKDVNNPSTQKPKYETVDSIRTWDVYPHYFHPNNALNNVFKKNTQYRVHIKLKHYTMYQDIYRAGGFWVCYSDGTYEKLICDGNTGWNTFDIITDANKTISYIYVQYYVSQRVYVDINSYIKEYIPCTITEKGVLNYNNISEVGITDGLVAYYPFDKNANDYSGNKNHGTVNGAVLINGIVRGQCYSFDGIDNYINTNIPVSVFNDNKSFTISLWVKLNDMSKSQIIFGEKDNEVVRLIIGMAFPSNTWTLGIGNIGTGNSGIAASINITHLVLTVNHITNTAILYVDSVPKINRSDYTWTNLLGSPGIGCLKSLTDCNYMTNGYIDDVRVYNKALTDEEIKILYDMYNPNGSKMKLTKDTIYLSGKFKEVI